MPDTAPLARSSIRPAPPVVVKGGWEVSGARSSAGLRVCDLTPLAKVLVRVAAGGVLAQSLGCGFGRSARDGDGNLVVGSGPGEWLILAPSGHVDAVISKLEAVESDQLTTLVDMTHFAVVLRLTGEAAPDLLAKVCAIDLSDRTTPNGAAFRSSVARLGTNVVRDDLDGERSYLLYGDRSSGQFLLEALMDAGEEFGIEIDGYPDKEI